MIVVSTTFNAELAEPAEHSFFSGYSGAAFNAAAGEFADQGLSAGSAFDVVA
jgi:hypothetical protein